jgi:thioredoxin reductase (NADPH)
MDYELAIIGAGPAGYSAGIYAVRAGLKTVLFDNGNGGGLASIAPKIENYTGFPSISGADLMEKMKEHAKHYVDFHEYEEIIDISKKKNGFVLTTSEKKTYKVGAVVLATGTKHRKLDAKGANDFEGKGISYCATCDGFFFKNKTVCVVGGGNSALIEAIFLQQIGCKQVYVIHRRDTLRAEDAYAKKAKDVGVSFLLNTIVKEIKGNQVINSVVLNELKTGKIWEMNIDGMFISIGVMPQNDLAKKLRVDIDEYGYIKVDHQMRTSVKGVYAAGDITGGLRQIITAAAQGAIAALSSTESLGKQYPY